MRRAQVTFFGGESAQLKFSRRDNLGGISRREADKMGGPIDGYSVQGLQVSAHISATDIVTGRAVGSPGDAGQRLDVFHKVRFARRSDHHEKVLRDDDALTHHRLPRPRITLDGGRQRISPVVFLGTGHKRKQQEQEDDKQKPDGFKTHRQDPHRFVGCAWIYRPAKCDILALLDGR